MLHGSLKEGNSLVCPVLGSKNDISFFERKTTGYGVVVLTTSMHSWKIIKANYSLHLEDRGSKILQNSGMLLQHYTASPIAYQ